MKRLHVEISTFAAFNFGDPSGIDRLLRTARRLLPWLPFRSPADHSLSGVSQELRTDARALPGSIPRCTLYHNSKEGWAKPILLCCMVTHRGIEPRSTPSESATLSVELMGHIEYLSACYLGVRSPFLLLCATDRFDKVGFPIFPLRCR